MAARERLRGTTDYTDCTDKEEPCLGQGLFRCVPMQMMPLRSRGGQKAAKTGSLIGRAGVNCMAPFRFIRAIRVIRGYSPGRLLNCACVPGV